MIEYRIMVVVGLNDHTWYETECTYLAENDSGDNAACRAAEQQVLDSLPADADVNFVLANSVINIEEKEEEEEPAYEAWLKVAQRLAKERDKEFDLDTARIAWEKDYTPISFVKLFAYYPDD